MVVVLTGALVDVASVVEDVAEETVVVAAKEQLRHWACCPLLSVTAKRALLIMPEEGSFWPLTSEPLANTADKLKTAVAGYVSPEYPESC